MTLDLSSVPTISLVPILVLSLGVVGVIIHRAAARYRGHRSLAQIDGMILLGGAALAVGFEAAVQLFLVRGGG